MGVRAKEINSELFIDCFEAKLSHDSRAATESGYFETIPAIIFVQLQVPMTSERDRRDRLPLGKGEPLPHYSTQ